MINKQNRWSLFYLCMLNIELYYEYYNKRNIDYKTGLLSAQLCPFVIFHWSVH